MNKPQYQYRINVHDELVFYIPKKTIEEDLLFIIEEMVRPVHNFINVPLQVEASLGTNWGDLEGVGKFNSTIWFKYKGDCEWK